MKATRRSVISVRRALRAASLHPTSYLKSIMRTSIDAIALCDECDRVIICNSSFKRIFGYSSREAVGLPMSEFIPEWPHGRSEERDTGEKKCAALSGRAAVEVNGRAKTGELIPVGLASTEWREDASTFRCCVIRDLSGQRETEQRLRNRLMRDELTDLPNRQWFMETLQTTIDRHCRQPDSEFAVLCVNVNGFRMINDGLGAAAGDAMLVEVADRLGRCARSGDTVGRLGDDRFVVLLDELKSVNDALRVAERICEHASEPFTIGDETVSITVSIGITAGSIGYEQAEKMLHDSHSAMHRAKSAGQGQIQIFDRQMHVKAAARLRVENELRMALAEDQLRLHYQPIVDLATSRIIGFEALARWMHPTKGMVPPMSFIPIAEEGGLIVPIGIWTLREACRQAKDWHARFPHEPPVYISVNMSPKQLACRSLLDDVAAALRLTDGMRGLIKLEITEGALLDNSNEVLAALLQLKHMGIKLFLDDFGTGYSSLSYLHRFPFDALKIDRSFVNKIEGSPRDLTIVRTIVDLAHSLDLKVIAEGVETAGQAKCLEGLRCEYAQGYLYSKPVEVVAATLLLAKQAEHGRRQMTALPRPALVEAAAAI